MASPLVQDNYNHPSYITRQMEFLGATTAGANGTSLVQAAPTAMRVRRATTVVKTAGTASTAAVNVISLNGTTTSTLGSVTVGTAAANTVFNIADMNFALAAGALLYFTNGADATGVSNVMIEWHLDPNGGQWNTP